MPARGRPLSASSDDARLTAKRAYNRVRQRNLRDRTQSIINDAESSRIRAETSGFDINFQASLKISAERILSTSIERASNQEEESQAAIGLRIGDLEPIEEERNELAARLESYEIAEHDELYLDNGVEVCSDGFNSSDSDDDVAVDPEEVVQHYENSIPSQNGHGTDSSVGIRAPTTSREINDEDASSSDLLHESGAADTAVAVDEPDIEDEENEPPQGQDEEQEALLYTAEKLGAQVYYGFHGCSDSKHLADRNKHDEATGPRPHYNLAGIPELTNAISALKIRDTIQTSVKIRSEQWNAALCGIDENHSRPRDICLHRELVTPTPASVTVDIDSFLGFAYSLAFAKQGIHFQPAPQFRQNLKTDIHMEESAKHYIPQEEGEDKETYRPTMLKKMHHIYFGRLPGRCNTQVYILFPHLARNAHEFICLTDEQLSRWYDEIVVPSLQSVLPDDVKQHIILNYRNAKLDSRARQKETHKVETASYHGQDALHYFLDAQYLEQIWQEIIDKTNTADYSDFRNPVLFFCAKNLKLQFKSALRDGAEATRPVAFNKFQNSLDEEVDMDFVNHRKFFVDIGREVTAQRRSTESEAHTYSWKRCCLTSYVQWLYGPSLQNKPAAVWRFFEQNLLHEAVSMTSLTPKGSQLRKGGLLYSQFYNVSKEIFDGPKTFPFQNNNLEILAIDERIIQATRSRGFNTSPKVVMTAYQQSKERARVAIKASRHKSYGVREEHRISWTLFRAIDSYRGTDRANDRVPQGYTLPEAPSYVWAIRTKKYANFLASSIDRFATGFEAIHFQTRGGMIKWSQTLMMAMFLRCLRSCVISQPLSEDAALWWGHRENETRTTYGLGFGNTIGRYGYAWIEPRFDWNKVEFDKDIASNLLFGNRLLYQYSLKTRFGVTPVYDNFEKIGIALDRIHKHNTNYTVISKMIRWMVQIVLLQFRTDTLSRVAKVIGPDIEIDDETVRQPFCFEFFYNLTRHTPHIVKGNRTIGSRKTPSEFFKFLFQSSRYDGMTRRHWDTKEYRVLYDSVDRELSRMPVQVAVPGSQRSIDCLKYFQQMTRHDLFEYHWLLPYPDTNGFMQKTKDTSDLMWYSVIHTTDRDGLRKLEWGGVRKTKPYMIGTPTVSPSTFDDVFQGETDCDQWIERMTTTRSTAQLD